VCVWEGGGAVGVLLFVGAFMCAWVRACEHHPVVVCAVGPLEGPCKAGAAHIWGASATRGPRAADLLRRPGARDGVVRAAGEPFAGDVAWCAYARHGHWWWNCLMRCGEGETPCGSSCDSCMPLYFQQGRKHACTDDAFAWPLVSTCDMLLIDMDESSSCDRCSCCFCL
jgi:hypothetical protein